MFYETKRDLFDILVPYFKAGLGNKEFCLWVSPQPETEDEVLSELRNKIPDLERWLTDGSMEIVQQEDWFFEGGQWDLQRIISRVQEKLAGALARGYAGMRLNGSTAWLQSQAKDFHAFESALDDEIAGQPLIVLCTFPLAQIGAAELLDAGHTHLFAGALRNGQWQVLETPELKLAQEEVRTLTLEFVDAVKQGALNPQRGPAGEPGIKSPLTPRELEVLEWVARGKSAWEIAAILNITKRTVDGHVANAIQKLGAVNRIQAIAIAVRDRIIKA